MDPTALWTAMGVLVAAVGILIAWVWRVNDKRDKSIDDLKSNHDVLEKDFLRYQTLVSQTFASNSYLKDVENRLMGAVERIEDKVDALTKAMTGKASA